MTEIRVYLNILHEIEISNFKLELLAGHGDSIAEELESNTKLRSNLEDICKKMSMSNPVGDRIRLGFLHVAEGYLTILTRIASWNGLYPDLGQGMIIPGYLLSKLAMDIRTALETEGDYNPVSDLMVTREPWKVQRFSDVIEQFRVNLMDRTFDNKMQAVECYNDFNNTVTSLHKTLMDEGIVPPYR